MWVISWAVSELPEYLVAVRQAGYQVSSLVTIWKMVARRLSLPPGFLVRGGIKLKEEQVLPGIGLLVMD
jgi:hypothetical protein